MQPQSVALQIPFSIGRIFSWNRLPQSLREIISPNKFKIKLLELIWKDLVTLEHDSDNEYILIHEIDYFSDHSFPTKIYRNLIQHAENVNM